MASKHLVSEHNFDISPPPKIYKPTPTTSLLVNLCNLKFCFETVVMLLWPTTFSDLLDFGVFLASVPTTSLGGSSLEMTSPNIEPLAPYSGLLWWLLFFYWERMKLGLFCFMFQSRKSHVAKILSRAKMCLFHRHAVAALGTVPTVGQRPQVAQTPQQTLGPITTTNRTTQNASKNRMASLWHMVT